MFSRRGAGLLRPLATSPSNQSPVQPRKDSRDTDSALYFDISPKPRDRFARQLWRTVGGSYAEGRVDWLAIAQRLHRAHTRDFGATLQLKSSGLLEIVGDLQDAPFAEMRA